MIALIEFVEGFDHPAGRIQQAFALGVFADIIEQGLYGVLGFGARWPWLVRADSGCEKFGRIEFSRPDLRNPALRLHVGALARAKGFYQSVHLYSVRPISNGPECHRQTGRFAAGRLKSHILAI
jgi:hypothetical protein